MKLKNILYATDLSSGADNAGRRSLQLQAEHGATLRVLSVLSGGPGVEARGRAPGADSDTALAAQIDDQTQSMRERLMALGTVDDGRTEFVCEHGQGYRKILEHAEAMKADLIVVGSHGQRRIQDVLLGTTTHNLVNRTERPILVVKNAATGAYQRAVVPVDFSALSSAALRWANALATQSPLLAIHAFDMSGLDEVLRNRIQGSELKRIEKDVQADRQLELERFLDASKLGEGRYEAKLVLGQAHDMIAKTVAQAKADLVVMGTHGRGRIKDALLGGVARRVVHQIKEADVLLVRK